MRRGDGNPFSRKMARFEDRDTGSDFSDPAPPTTMRRMFLPALRTASIWRSVTPRSWSVSFCGGA